MLRRHDRVYLRIDRLTPEAMKHCGVSAHAVALVRAWCEAGHPFAARRCDDWHKAGGLPHKTAISCIPLAFRLPGTKPGIAFAAPSDALRGRLRALPLAEAVPAAFPTLRPDLNAFAREAEEAGLSFLVYGSLFWQAVTCMDYMTAGSDIDLLYEPETRASLHRALLFLESRDAIGGHRLDGEVVFPCGAGVSWRELRSGAGRLLVKRMGGVALVPAHELLAQLEAVA